MTTRLKTSRAESQLILSLFHGIDLFGRGFEAEGFCVVRAAEKILNFPVEDLHLPRRKFNGIIAGSPCQDFSTARRTAPTGDGERLLKEFSRLVLEAAPDWFLLENVPGVPDVIISGYQIQRFNLNAKECGIRQNRLRCFQFGSRAGKVLIIERQPPPPDVEPCCMASEGKDQNRRSFSKFCELQGLPKDFSLPSFKLSAKYEAVGNGVPVGMAQTIAKAVKEALLRKSIVTLCACFCGRRVTGRQKLATAACRKRMQRNREASSENLRRRVTI